MPGQKTDAAVDGRIWDLRLVVAGGSVVGAARRIARSGEWRTNAALGAQVEPVEPPPIARALALSAAQATRADLVGVDLLPTPNGGFVVLELNGAVDVGVFVSFLLAVGPAKAGEYADAVVTGLAGYYKAARGSR